MTRYDCVVVAPSTEFPKRCVHCGSTKALRKDRLRFTAPSAVAAVGLLGILGTFGLPLAFLARTTISPGVAAEVWRCRRCVARHVESQQRTGSFAILAAGCMVGRVTSGFNHGPLVLTALLGVVAIAVVAYSIRAWNGREHIELRAIAERDGAVWVAHVHPRVQSRFPENLRVVVER